MTRVRARVCVFIIVSPKCVDSWCLYMYILFLFHTSTMICQDPKTHDAVTRFGNIGERLSHRSLLELIKIADTYAEELTKLQHTMSKTYILSMKYTHELR